MALTALAILASEAMKLRQDVRDLDSMIEKLGSSARDRESGR